MKNRFIYLLGLLAFVACKPEALDPDTERRSQFPLLPEGQHISMIRGFNADNSPAVEDSMDLRWEEAVAQGMQAARIQIDWAELEASPGVYDTEALNEVLMPNHQAGLASMLTLSTLDSEGYTIPEDLESFAIDSEEIIERLKALMDWMVPLLSENGVWSISMANEPDTQYEADPDMWKKLRNMMAEMVPYIHRLNPDMAVSITFTEGGFAQGLKGYAQIIAECDFACFNYYGQDFEGVDTQAEVTADLRALLDLAGEKSLVIQELGCSAGYAVDSQIPGATLANQAVFFETVFSLMQSEPRFRVAYIFQLVDWSTATVDLISQSLIDEGVDQTFIDQFAESLLTVGLIEYETGEARPAWPVVLDWMGRIR